MATVRLRNKQDLRHTMAYRGMTVRQLSVLCGGLKHRSTIGNLHSGARSTCSPVLAACIEEALVCYPGSLFELVSADGRLVTAPPAPSPRRRTAA